MFGSISRVERPNCSTTCCWSNGNSSRSGFLLTSVQKFKLWKYQMSDDGNGIFCFTFWKDLVFMCQLCEDKLFYICFCLLKIFFSKSRSHLIFCIDSICRKFDLVLLRNGWLRLTCMDLQQFISWIFIVHSPWPYHNVCRRWN